MEGCFLEKTFADLAECETENFCYEKNYKNKKLFVELKKQIKFIQKSETVILQLTVRF